MTSALLIAALFMGFFGSPHCLGMCGGLVAAFSLSMQELSATKRRALIATYHFGRLLSYASLGLIAGLIGTTVLASLMVGNNLPRILLGLVLVFVGMTMLGLPFLTKLERFGMRFWQALAPLRKKVFPLTSYPRALTAGLLWGFLPCGLVYGALLIAVVGHDPLTGAVLMFAFGLGTIPMLVATHKTVGFIRNQVTRLRLRQINGAIMVLSGLAVAIVPMVMANMHSGHDMATMSNDGSSSHMPMTDSAMKRSHDMDSGAMNHEGMDHTKNYSEMDHKGMDHSTIDHENMSN